MIDELIVCVEQYGIMFCYFLWDAAASCSDDRQSHRLCLQNGSWERVVPDRGDDCRVSQSDVIRHLRVGYETRKDNLILNILRLLLQQVDI